MRILLISICFLGCSFSGNSQKNLLDSTEMINRLDTFMFYSQLLNFEKILDYTYPKLFTLASRQELKETMENAFIDEDINIKMDSLKIVKINPIFEDDEGKYARITYSMLINMSLKEELDSSGMQSFLDIMKTNFGDKNVWLDITGMGINIFQQVDMAAVKDTYSPAWTFTNLIKDDPLMNTLFNKDLFEKFYANYE